MRGKLTPVYVLAGLFLILSPLSMATGLESSQAAKYLRLLTTLLIVLVGLASSRSLRFGTASKAMLAFAAVWVASATWSDLPHWALFYKGAFALTLVSGTMLGATPRRLVDVEQGLRFLAFVSLLASLVVVLAYVRDPSSAMRLERLAVWGINANLIAQTAAPLSVFCVFLAVNDRRRLWKSLAVIALALLLIVMLLTGSRGGVAMAFVGAGLVLIPYGKRPAVLIVSLGFVIAIGYVALEFLAQSDSVRLFDELTKNTRSGVWHYAFHKFESSPLIGHGWLHHGSSWSSVQGAFPQVLAEAGSLGATVLLITVLTILSRWYSVNSRLKRRSDISQYTYLSAALIISHLVHGMAESSTVMGTSLNPLLLGMGVSLLDHLPSLAQEASPNRGRQRERMIAAITARQQSNRPPATVVGHNGSSFVVAQTSDRTNRPRT